ncbi:copper homeostasis protein cutC homolog [Topomyia yanbarensis]|uniref:copper homeostasis protein cutC homolog n=1 Tax=Topomyia yanbarensis TaxID=2498891 RepID=UPI00273B55B1|nr:copper homeostasis protein cutC homolog [Topomyia yanbarensis]
MSPLLEICIDSFESALAAIRGGADRLELCAALSEGGLTPLIGLLREVRNFVLTNDYRTQLYAMIRCRRGSDFCYSDMEMKIMVHDLKLLAENGADGFVFGALTDGGEIHSEHCRLIVKETQAVGKPVTFHRAFDCTAVEKMVQNLKVIASLGFSTILTSGFERTAIEGVNNVARLVDITEEEEISIVIMPGSGITSANAKEIVQKTKCAAVHASARSTKKTGCSNALPMGSISKDDNGLLVCDENIVRAIKNLIVLN